MCPLDTYREDIGMLQSEDLDYFRAVLTERLEELVGKTAHVVTEMISSGEKLIDPVDIATAECSRTATLRIRDRESKLARKIADALERIESGTFGFCEICEEEINTARLMARPVTSHCIRCKTVLERVRGTTRVCRTERRKGMS